jgi:hypothetical protein
MPQGLTQPLPRDLSSYSNSTNPNPTHRFKSLDKAISSNTHTCLFSIMYSYAIVYACRVAVPRAVLIDRAALTCKAAIAMPTGITQWLSSCSFV